MTGRDIRLQPCSATPELALIAHTEIRAPMPRLDIPCAADSANLYISTKGSKQMQCQGQTYTLNGGEFFWTPMGVDHATGPMPLSKCTHYWVRLTLDGTGSFLGDPAGAELRDQLAGLPVVRARADQECVGHAEHCYRLATEEPGFARDHELRMRLNLLLLKLLEAARAGNGSSPTNPVIAALTEHIDQHLSEAITVEDLARALGMANSTLSELCQREIGIPPAEFVMRRKLDEAERLLIATDLPVREISDRLGFNNERYFSTVFRRFHPQPPGRFRSEYRDNH